MSEKIKQFEEQLQNASSIIAIEVIINEALKDASVLEMFAYERVKKEIFDPIHRILERFFQRMGFNKIFVFQKK